MYKQLTQCRYLLTLSKPLIKNQLQVSRCCSTNVTSFALGVFDGKLNTKEVFPYPDVLSDDEKATTSEIMTTLDKYLTENNDAGANDLNEKVPEKVLNDLKEFGVFGGLVDPKFGGIGFKNTQYAAFAEIFSRHDLGLSVLLGAHQSIGYKGIMLFGTEAQKEKYLPSLASGKLIACFCLTEPSSGSDAGSIRSKAVKSADGKHYILNGGKIWISNGSMADVFTVFARTPVKDKTTGVVKDKISAFIVERKFGGVTNSAPEKKMGIKCCETAEVHFDNVKIPVENLLGQEGQGFKIAMKILNNGRFGLATGMSGVCKGVLNKATEWAKSRTQFGSKIMKYEDVQEKLSRMAMLHYVSESMGYMIASNMDRGVEEFQLEAAMAKVFCSEAAWYSTDEAIQIFGGMGFMRGAELERIQRDLRIFRIFEGTNDIMRLFVALLGVQHAGKSLKGLQKLVAAPMANIKALTNEGSRRLMRMVGNDDSVDLTPYVDSSLVLPAAQVSNSIVNFSSCLESVLMKHGKEIIERQFLLRRIADASIGIFAMAVSLSRCSASIKRGSPSAAHEQQMVNFFCDETSRKVLHLTDEINRISRGGFDTLKDVSDNIVEHDGAFHESPIGIKL